MRKQVMPAARKLEDRHDVAVATQRDDLRGRLAISYERFSAVRSARGSSLDRQAATRDFLLDKYGMTLDPKYIDVFTDRAKSAYGAVHRKRGKLGVLLKMCGLDANGNRLVLDGKPVASEFTEGTPLIIEAIDRLFREVVTTSFHIIAAMVQIGGLIIVTGQGHIIDRVTINTEGGRLVSDIIRANEEAKRLGEKIFGAHYIKRTKLRQIMAGIDRPLPLLNPPAWVQRSHDNGQIAYTRKDPNARTLEKIFELALEGLVCRKIAAYLNEHADLYPPFAVRARLDGSPAKWNAAYISQLLQDRRVRGWYLPHTRKQATEIEVQIFPIIIDDAVWLRTQEILKAREKIGGRGRGNPYDKISNLFTGHMFCGCGGRLRVHSATFTYHCSNDIEATCEFAPNYRIAYYEPQILLTLCEMESLVPVGQDHTTAILQTQHATLQLQIEQNVKYAQSLEISAKQEGDNHVTTGRIVKIDFETANLKREADLVQQQISDATAPVSRHSEVWAFVKSHVQQRHDPEIRERLRGLLATCDYIITPDPAGGLRVRMGMIERYIKQPPDNLQPIHIGKTGWNGRAGEPARGSEHVIEGKRQTYLGCGWWRHGTEPARRIAVSFNNVRGPQIGDRRKINDVPMMYTGSGWWQPVVFGPKLRRLDCRKQRRAEQKLALLAHAT